ncbi:MAG: TolC family protein [Bacteriovoracaceae bacterium]|nr:TolC family protein [Bacteriovoracaceae bacterium]
MNKWFIFIHSIVISLGVEASTLHKISSEFLGVNQAIDLKKIDTEQSKIDLELIDAYRYWSLFYEGSIDDSGLESSSTLTSNPIKSNNHTLGVTKNFDWGGNFSFSNTMRSLSGSNFFGTLNGKTYGFSQTVSYSQDLGKNFLGRNDRSEIHEAELYYGLKKVLLSTEKEKGLLQLTSSWVDVKLSLALLKLQEEALIRAKRRESLVTRRVKDGLKERVDLYQAKGSRELQKEELRNAEISLKKSLESLGKNLHRKVQSNEFKAFGLNSVSKENLPSGNIEGNKEIKSLETKLQILESEYSRKDNSLTPSVSLTGSYTSNDFDSTRSKSISSGSLGSDTKETSIGVSLTWPLWSRPAKLERSKTLIEKKLTTQRKTKISTNVEITERFFKDQIELLNKNVISGKIRRDLASRALAEYNKLYNKGRADLDQVIRAEEELIRTEKQFVRSVSNRKKVIFSLAYLYGTLGEYCLKEAN